MGVRGMTVDSTYGQAAEAARQLNEHADQLAEQRAQLNELAVVLRRQAGMLDGLRDQLADQQRMLDGGIGRIDRLVVALRAAGGAWLALPADDLGND